MRCRMLLLFWGFGFRLARGQDLPRHPKRNLESNACSHAEGAGVCF